MLTKEVLINSLRPYCGVIMEYDRRSGRLCIHWGNALTDGVRQRWLMPEQLREEIRRSGTAVSEEAAVWYRYLNAGYLQSFFRRGAESEEFRMEFQTSDRQMKRYDIRVEKLDADTLLISGRVVREDGVDALTGVYSRSYYEMHMKAGAVRGGVAIIDLDDLKLCNDTYGHDGGDKLLTAAAQVMQDAAGMDGQVVRYGGDEFLLLLPGVGENDFPAVLEDVRARIAALRLPEQSGLRLTASIGGVMARDETVAGAVLCAVFSFLLVCNVTIIVKGTLHPETPPTVLGVAPMVVLSGSMSGTAEDHIEVGDLIFTTKPDTEALQVGDVVAFKDGNVVVTHRIVAVTADESGKKQFITKGDANNTEDPAIYPDSVIGVYRGRIPKLGDFALFLQKPLGMAVFIGIPVCTFVIGDVIRRRKQAQHSDEETARLREELERLKAASGSGAAPQ